MSLEQQISKGIMEAMKAKDTVRLGALRNAKKYIIEAKTAGPEIAELPDADVLKIISKLAKQGADSAAIFTEQNRPDLAAEELAQVAVFQEYLPRQLTPEELEAEVRAVIAEVGATSVKEMGKVMGVVTKKLADVPTARIFRPRSGNCSRKAGVPMKRLLFVLCSLVAVQEVCARRPAVRFDLPYTVEHGKYVVVLGTPAGPRRFIFDTGATGTCISESLRDELGAEIVKTQKVRDFEGHVVPIDLVRLDSLRMGDALFRDHPVLVMPDTSLVFACLRVDGIAGCDLLRWCAVRMPNADTTISVTDDVRRLGLPRGRRMSRMELGGGCPFLPVTCRNGDRQARMYVKFDTGSAGYFHFSYADSGDAPPPPVVHRQPALGRRICVGYRLDEPQQGEQLFPGYDPPVRNSGARLSPTCPSNAPSATTGSSAASC